VDGVYSINVTKPGTANWHICDQQGDVLLEKDATYLVSFDAKADIPGSMDVYLAKNYGDYGQYYSTVKNVTNVMQHFSWTIKMLQPSDARCRFGFGFRRFTGKVYLDNVSIEKQVISVTEIFKANEHPFDLFPNPANDFLDFTNQSAKTLQPTIRLFNLQGQLISNLWENEPILAGQQIRMNLIECNAGNGIYLVHISTDENSVTRKLIINRH